MADVCAAPDAFPVAVETLIIGAGAAGLTAAIAAREAGQEVLVLERDPVPSGSTALSAGLIPAAGTAQQKAAALDDDAACFADDIQRKAKGQNDPALVELLATGAAPLIDWLTETHGLPFTLVDDFDYPGHSCRRMHGLPTRSGRELIDRLRATAETFGADLLCEATVTTLFTRAGRIAGLALTRPDDSGEVIGCNRLILACNGFGGNRPLVRQHMPEIEGALWFGHDGNRGEALDWGAALGAAARHLGAYQGHGNVAHPHGILITWATITEGGLQVNRNGERFWDESQGYSEAARAVLAQPGRDAVTIFDARIAGIARQFADFRAAEAQGAVATAASLDEIADRFDLPKDALAATVAAVPERGKDSFGRRWSGPRLSPPYAAVRVTGALFHTQGGLCIDRHARVLKTDGTPIPNLFAAGGAAVGVSGSGDAGYLSGNGLLAATVLGRIAGKGC
ncbi:MAG: FAD-dependent oxidoreductase [Pseudomonadota bacterium]